MGKFEKGDPRASIYGKRGGEKRALQRRVEKGPYVARSPFGAMLDVQTAAGRVGPTFLAAAVIAKVSEGKPLNAEELAWFREHTGLEDAPTVPPKEIYLICGRRGGKTAVMADAAFARAITFDTSRLGPGEQAKVMIIAKDKSQARVLKNYMAGLAALPEFAPWVFRVLRDRIEFQSGVVAEVHVCSYKSTRGFTCIGIFADEVSFWSVEGSNPDAEVFGALRPSMATIPDAQLWIASTPYHPRGVVYDTHERYYGVEDEHVCVINASTLAMNPSVSPRIIEREFEQDAVAAASEYGIGPHVKFRGDLAPFISPEALKAVTVPGRLELPPQRGISYRAFVDPSGGARDEMVLAIGHAEGGKAILDCIRSRKPPFSPDSVCAEFAAVCRQYGIKSVVGDRWGSEWVVERFARFNIRYEHSERTKSELYLECLAPLNSGTVELLDLGPLRYQLLALERRTARGGKDSVDHPKNSHDDIANGACGVLSLVVPLVAKGPRAAWLSDGWRQRAAAGVNRERELRQILGRGNGFSVIQRNILGGNDK